MCVVAAARWERAAVCKLVVYINLHAQRALFPAFCDRFFGKIRLGIRRYTFPAQNFSSSRRCTRRGPSFLSFGKFAFLDVMRFFSPVAISSFAVLLREGSFCSLRVAIQRAGYLGPNENKNLGVSRASFLIWDWKK